MKITSVTCHLLTVDLADAGFSWPGGSMRYWTAAVVEVTTSDGVHGLGACYAGLFAPGPTKALVDHFGELLVGEPFESVAALYERMLAKSRFWAKAGLPLAVIGVLENALWDIEGKVKAEPVWRLLGGRAARAIPVYASGGMDATEKGLTRELEGYLDKGFRAVKIRIGRTLKEDVDKVRLARRVLGGDVELMVDAVMGHHPNPWTASQALERAKALAEFDITWFEEPCGNLDYAGYARVRADGPLPVAGGESATGLHEYRAFFDADALDVVQPDAAHSGGILACRDVARLAASRGVQVAYHSWGSAPCLWANYHLAFSDPAVKILEFPTHGMPLVDALSQEPFHLVDGCFKSPEIPGLGVCLPPDVLKLYPYHSGRHLWP